MRRGQGRQAAHTLGRVMGRRKTKSAFPVGHLITTAKAVPHMLRVKERSDATSLQHALNSFGRWHLARTTADALTFAWNVRLLASLSKGIPAASN